MVQLMIAWEESLLDVGIARVRAKRQRLAKTQTGDFQISLVYCSILNSKESKREFIIQTDRTREASQAA